MIDPYPPTPMTEPVLVCPHCDVQAVWISRDGDQTDRWITLVEFDVDGGYFPDLQEGDDCAYCARCGEVTPSDYCGREPRYLRSYDTGRNPESGAPR